MKIFRYCYTILLFFGLVSVSAIAASSDGTGPDNGYDLVHDFQHDWLIYDQEEKSYVPYTRTLHDNDPSINLVVDLLKYRNYDLLIKTTTQNHLFINGALQKVIPAQQWIVLNGDSLYKAHAKDDLLLTFFGNERVSHRIVQIAHKKDLSILREDGLITSLINIKPIRTSKLTDLFTLVALVILALNGLVFSIAPLFYRSFMNPMFFFKKDWRDEKIVYTNPFSMESFFMILQLALLMTPFMLLISNFYSTNTIHGWLSGDTEQWVPLLKDFFEGFFIALLTIYLKYFSVKLNGNLLNIEATANPHFMKTLQSSFHFYLLICIILVMCSLYSVLPFAQLLPILAYTTIGFYVLRFLLLYFIMNISGPFINLYLFSYLCIVEIIPLTIGIKLML